MCIALAAVPNMPMLPSGASVVSFSLMLMENYKYTLLCNCMQIVLLALVALHSMLRKKEDGRHDASHARRKETREDAGSVSEAN